MKTLKDWFSNPESTLTYDYNKPQLTRGLMGQDAVHTIAPPATLVDLAAYPTPFCVLFNRPKNQLTG